MNTKLFEDVLDAQIKRVRDVLVVKAQEYAPIDRLSNFRKAATLQQSSIPQAIAGMMVKHVVSIFDMVKEGIDYPIETWDEKITDNINYLILLRAAIEEEKRAKENDHVSESFHRTASN